MKRVLVSKHRMDFYGCLAEKMITYALGRGVEYYDVEALDRITAGLERGNVRFSALLTGIVESAPFQRRRGAEAPAAPVPAKKEEQRAETINP